MRLRTVIIALLLSSVAHAEGLKPELPGASLVCPILVDKVNEDAAWVFPSDDPAKFFIEAAPLLEVTEKYLPDEAQKKLRSFVTHQKVINLLAIRSLGMDAELDQQALNLNLKIPPKIRKEGELRIVGLTPGGEGIIGSAPFSGYVNTLVGESYTYPSGSNPSQGTPGARQPLTSQINSVMNLRGWDLESGAAYTENQIAPWRRADTHLIHDEQDSMMRYTGGDLPLVTRGFQSTEPIGGISATRDFTIQPYRTTRPVNRTQIFLNRPSIVEVFVNGGFVSRLQLPAGPVDLKDFPLASGRNDLVIKVTDDLGQKETINLSMLFDAQLLSMGLSQFSYSAGFPSSPTATDRSYDTSNFTFSGFHRVGLTETLTLGGNFQHDKNTNLIGVEEVWATPLGTFATDVATSQGGSYPAGMGYHLQYRSPEHTPGGPARLLITANSQYLSPSFASVGVITPLNQFSWLQDIYASQQLLWKGRVGAGYRYEWGRDGNPDQQTVMADYSWNWSRNFQTGVNYSMISNTVPEHRAYITLTWTDDPGRTQVYATVDTAAARQRVDINRQPERPYDDVRISGGAQHDPNSEEGDVHAQYLGNHGQLNLDHQTQAPNQGVVTNTTGLTAGVALAWAGNSVGITRPINDSFAIIRDVDSTGLKVPVNDNGKYSEAVVNTIGPAVIPDLLSYYDRAVSLNTSVLPEGYRLIREHQVARPTYHSGVEVPIHILAFIAAKGILVDDAGQPVSLASGEIYVQGASEPMAGSFFTNTHGGFFIEGLKPGKYEIRVFGGQWKPVPFDIQPPGKGGPAGVVDIGTQIARRTGS